MRGRKCDQPQMFFTIDVEARIREDHPLRNLKRTIDEILRELAPRFDAAYSRLGRPSIPPERLLKALLLMVLYSLRSEKQLVERIDTDLLFRWFLDMSPEEQVFDATGFTHNRPRLDEHGLTAAFFDAVVKRAFEAGLCSDEHFSVDGSLIESYASIKSFRPREEPQNEGDDDSRSFKPRNASVDFHGEKKTNETHVCRTDPEARLYRKSSAHQARLSHMGHALTENRHGLVLAVAVTPANGMAERLAALAMLDQLKARQGLSPKTLGSDKGYDSGHFFVELEGRGIVPHSAVILNAEPDPKNVTSHRKAGVRARKRMKERVTSLGYELSQRCRKKVEEYFGWMKTVAGLARSRWVGRWKIRQQMELTGAAYNLVRMRKLLATG
jgi:transposase